MNLLHIFLSVAWALASINLQANISPLAFKGIFKHFNPGYEFYAPNIGCAALKNGTVDAIRFYNVIPGPKDTQGRRMYIQDKASKNDPFAELAILLFPSPAGQLAAITSHPNNIGRHMNVDDVATLLKFCAKVRDAVKMNKSSESMKGNEFGKNIKKSLKLLVEAHDNNKKLLKKDRRIIYYDQRTPEQYLRSLRISSTVLRLPSINKLLSLLCKSIELEERNDRKEAFIKDSCNRKNFEKYHEATFYPKYTPEMLLNTFFCLKFGSEQIQDLINSLDDQMVDHQILFDDGLIDQTDLKQAAQKDAHATTLDDLWVIQNRNLIDSVIPYARQCKPVNNGLACGYDRVNNKLLETETYPDCTETTLRHLCNLVFYDKKTKNWNLHAAQQTICDPQILECFDNFYQIQKPEKANSGEAAIRNAWSKIVNNLNGNIRYKEKFIKTSMKNDNEIASGIVNIIRVLNIIFNLDFGPEPLYKNDEQFAEAVTTWTEAALQKMFTVLSPDKNAEINIYNVEAYSVACDHDCSGLISVTVDKDFTFQMSINNDHAQFDKITVNAPEEMSVNNTVVAQLMAKFKNKLCATAGEQLQILHEKTKDLATTSADRLFQQAVCDSVEIVAVLERLYDMIVKKEITDTRTLYILKNLLQKFLWQDSAMKKLILPVLLKLFSLNNDVIKTILSKEVIPNNLIFLMEKKISEELEYAFHFQKKDLSGLTKINLSYSQIKQVEISGDVCPNLQTLNLDYANITSLTLTGKLHALEEINFSNSRIKQIKISGDFPNLKTLNLQDRVDLESVTLTGKLHALEEINFSNSRIKQIKISGDCPNLKILNLQDTMNLKSITLTGKLHALEEINFSNSRIKQIKISGDCPNLKILNLQDTMNLKSVTLTGKFHALEKINFSNSRIKQLQISGNNWSNLKTLILSYTNNLKSVKLSGAFEQLEEIDLSGSEIMKLELDRESFPRLQTNDPIITFVDKKRKRNDDDQFENEIGKENKHMKLEKNDQAFEHNNANDKIMDNEFNEEVVWCNLL